MSKSKENIMIIAGEVSGDLIGAGLISELKRLNPKLTICGIGGDKMFEAGMELNFHIRDMAFLGFTEVIKHLPFIRSVQNNLIRTINEKNISLAVLIDYPGFNLNIARKIKALGVKIIYYVSPQVWAWGLRRVKKIKELVDKMIVLFPFEEKFYTKYSVDVNFVGHPLLDVIDDYKYVSKQELYEQLSLDTSKEILLLMPGSRKHEITKLFPEMMASAENICRDFNLQPVVLCPANIDKSVFNSLYSGNYTVARGYSYDLMKYSFAGIIKSGTSTLEAALFELPMVIVYRTSFLTYMIGKSLIKVKHIGMANIISGEKIVPELIQEDMNSASIYKELKFILSDQKKIDTLKRKLRDVKLKLGNKGASKRAAGIIYNELQKS